MIVGTSAATAVPRGVIETEAENETGAGTGAAVATAAGTAEADIRVHHATSAYRVVAN